MVCPNHPTHFQCLTLIPNPSAHLQSCQPNLRLTGYIGPISYFLAWTLVCFLLTFTACSETIVQHAFFFGGGQLHIAR